MRPPVRKSYGALGDTFDAGGNGCEVAWEIRWVA